MTQTAPQTAGIRCLLAGLALLVVTPGLATAVDQTIRGKVLVVRNPAPADATRRKVVAVAVEQGSPDVLVGDPTLAGSAGGAILHLVVDGGGGSAQTFALAQGTAASGRPFWKASARGFRYKDAQGEQGAVRSVRIEKSAGGTFRLKAVAIGRNGALDVVPPSLGLSGALTLAFGGGDRYCVRYGRDGHFKSRGDELFKVSRVTAEGCHDAGEFLALTYNVAGLPEGISGSEPTINTPLIGPLLNGYDLVLLQESWQTPNPNPFPNLRVFHEILAAASLHPFKSVPAEQPLQMDPFRLTAFLADGLNRFSQFPFEPVVRVPWNGCDNTAADCLALKGFSFTRMTLTEGVTVDVYNLHMEAGGSANDDVLRNEGVTQLVDFMNVHSVGRPVIMGGDFNLHGDEEPDATTLQRLYDEGNLVNACHFLGCPEPDRIDNFLFRSTPALAITPLSWSAEIDVFMREDGEPLSDHDAIAVRFAWDASPGP
jgi:hypothetical protein